MFVAAGADLKRGGAGVARLIQEPQVARRTERGVQGQHPC